MPAALPPLVSSSVCGTMTDVRLHVSASDHRRLGFELDSTIPAYNHRSEHLFFFVTWMAGCVVAHRQPPITHTLCNLPTHHTPINQERASHTWLFAIVRSYILYDAFQSSPMGTCTRLACLRFSLQLHWPWVEIWSSRS